MAYYIGNLENCQAYDKNVSEKENYLKGDNWANPQEIEGSWYILKHEKYTSEMELVSELPPQELTIE
jgi:hypothetical protein